MTTHCSHPVPANLAKDRLLGEQLTFIHVFIDLGAQEQFYLALEPARWWCLPEALC